MKRPPSSKFSDFCSTVEKLLNRYFGEISKATSRRTDIAYPEFIHFVESKDHFAFELSGSSLYFKPLRKSKIYLDNLNDYFCLAPPQTSSFGQNLVLEGVRNLRIWGFTILQNISISEAKEAFPIVGGRTVFLSGNETKPAAGFSRESSAVSLGHLVVIARVGNHVRAKFCVEFLQFSRDWSLEEMKSVIRSHATISPDPDEYMFGLISVSSDEWHLLVDAISFQTLYNSRYVKETTIGHFLDSHVDFVRRAFSCASFRSQVSLDWQKIPVESSRGAIRPDIMIQRSDGFYDIVEIKLGLPDIPSLVKGKSERRRFVDKVAEGIAQLANYTEYFAHQQNREHALQKYNIEVSDPKAILVIGNSGNMPEPEMREAMRSYAGTNLTIANYDFICQSLLASGRTAPP